MQSLLTDERQNISTLAEQYREHTKVGFHTYDDVSKILLRLQKQGLAEGTLIDGRKYYRRLQKRKSGL